MDGIFNGAELWVAYSKDNGQFADKTWSVGAKYQFPLAPKSNVNLALGASYRKMTGSADAVLWYDPFDSDWLYSDQFDDDVRNWDVYLAATMDLTAMDSSSWCGSGRLLGTAGVTVQAAQRGPHGQLEGMVHGLRDGQVCSRLGARRPRG